MPLSPLVTAIAGDTDATRLLYRSRDARDRPITVSGAYLHSTAPWHRPGPRPLIVYAPGTHGLADDCAPSRLLARIVTVRPPFEIVTEFEQATLGLLLSNGTDVVVTDYQGLGTPGVHTYMNRSAQAHAVLDAARAGLQLGDPNRPVGLFGYSQGGSAAAAAAEEITRYAPDLDIRGVYTGAAVADLRAALATGEEALGVSTYFLVFAGLVSAYPELREVIEDSLTDEALELLRAAENECTLQAHLANTFRSTRDWTRDGVTFDELIVRTPPLAAAFEEQRIGRGRPAVPVLVSTSSGDDDVPPWQVRRMAQDWCANGAEVRFVDSGTPVVVPGWSLGHLVGAIAQEPAGAQWLLDRIAGAPPGGNCG